MPTRKVVARAIPILIYVSSMYEYMWTRKMSGLLAWREIEHIKVDGSGTP